MNAKTIVPHRCKSVRDWHCGVLRLQTPCFGGIHGHGRWQQAGNREQRQQHKQQQQRGLKTNACCATCLHGVACHLLLLVSQCSIRASCWSYQPKRQLVAREPPPDHFPPQASWSLLSCCQHRPESSPGRQARPVKSLAPVGLCIQK